MSFCIGIGLGISEVKIIIRDGFPEKLFDLCQEMVSRNNYGTLPADSCHFILNIATYALLFERSFGKSREKNQNIEGNQKAPAAQTTLSQTETPFPLKE